MQKTAKARPLVVRVSHEAFLDMLMASAEAALVPPLMSDWGLGHLNAFLQRQQTGGANEPLPSLTLSQSGLEVAGVLCGHERRSEEGTALLIERMVPISAVNRTSHWIERSPISAEVMAVMAKAVHAPWKPMGDFHSHPLVDATHKQIEQRRLFGPSSQDRCAKGWLPKSRVGLIMSVAFAKRRPASGTSLRGRTLYRTRVADLDVWLCAYRAERHQPARLRLMVDFQT
ncbi:hypothetical protein [Methylobacterium sp. Leaf118]|uniref:hypothetical protein n=1 Tax=Methylobacterium sp. Leaf118 TaxID=2876562 RepID=UPI001E4A4FBC|nr:hypothetical protein [Methylobacterium sp. Leaf118]